MRTGQQSIESLEESRTCIPRAFLDWNFDQDENRVYRFEVDRNQHDLKVGDKVLLDVWGRPGTDQVTGTVKEVLSDSITVKADDYVDISEEYSIKRVS